VRGPDLARLTLGGLCLTRPELPLRWLRRGTRRPGPPGGRGTRTVVRVLGARYLVQAVGGPWLHRSWVPAVDAAVDLTHAASMVGLAAVAPGHRRIALASAAAATAFAVADLTHPEPGAHLRSAS